MTQSVDSIKRVLCPSPPRGVCRVTECPNATPLIFDVSITAVSVLHHPACSLPIRHRSLRAEPQEDRCQVWPSAGDRVEKFSSSVQCQQTLRDRVLELSSVAARTLRGMKLDFQSRNKRAESRLLRWFKSRARNHLQANRSLAFCFEI